MTYYNSTIQTTMYSVKQILRIIFWTFLLALFWVEHRCPGQFPWDPGTHRIFLLGVLFHWWETSQNSIWCHLDGRVHSRVCKRPGILSSRRDTDFLKMYKLGSRFYRSPEEKIIYIWLMKNKQTETYVGFSKHLKIWNEVISRSDMLQNCKNLARISSRFLVQRMISRYVI